MWAGEAGWDRRLRLLPDGHVDVVRDGRRVTALWTGAQVMVTGVSGLLDLTERRLVECGSRVLRELAARPEVLGL